MACGRMIFTKKNRFVLVLLHFIFSCSYCSIDLKRSRNIEGFSLIRAVLLNFSIEQRNCKVHKRHDQLLVTNVQFKKLETGGIKKLLIGLTLLKTCQ